MPIFDQGYQHWKGPLSPRAWRWFAIARNGIHVQMKNRSVRLLLLVAWLPAVALVVAMAVWGMVEQRIEGVMGLATFFLPTDVARDPRAYRETVWVLSYSYFFFYQMYLIMLLVVVAGPGLISRDLRFNALPMYFARPLTRFDYFLGKLGIIGALVAAVAVGPAVFAYLVGACFSLDFTVITDTYRVLFASVAYGLIITLSVGTLILAMSSLSRKSLYVGISWSILWLVSLTVGAIMTAIHQESARMEIYQSEMAKWVAANQPVPEGIEMRGSFPVRVQRLGPFEAQIKADKWMHDWQAAEQAAREKSRDRGEIARSDWRPLCSYVSNLERMGDFLFDTDSAWVNIGKASNKVAGAFGGAQARPPAKGRPADGPPGHAPPVNERPANDRFLADQKVLQFPWQWSAGLLAVLMGLSTWILLRRVQSLDRLK